LKHKTRQQKRAPLIIQETIIVEPQITIVEQNLGVINQLVQIAEQELAALVQAQVALVTQLQTIMNNIRINHFRAKFSQTVSLFLLTTVHPETSKTNEPNVRTRLSSR
jgi:flagellar biosynthesis/type III secretory pathway chaperone